VLDLGYAGDADAHGGGDLLLAQTQLLAVAHIAKPREPLPGVPLAQRMLGQARRSSAREFEAPLLAGLAQGPWKTRRWRR
jgi:hypothetical protein